jgi:hypothetical protein
MAINPAHDEAKHKQIVEYEVGADIRGDIDMDAREELVDVANLQNEDDNPVFGKCGSIILLA